MEDFKIYVGTKIIKARPCKKSEAVGCKENEEDAWGYKVVYPDGYVSWSPEEVFKTAYRKVTPQEKEML